MSEIYDLPLSFKITRGYLCFAFKRFYSEFIVVGKENIPAEGPVIFAPNHVNALMDALAVHSIAPNDMPIIFLARADLFKKKTTAKMLRFAKIMPAFRMRDGIENLGKNNKVFNQCVEVLDKNKALGIMPEGNQEIERKLRPLVKGIFRIAFAAQQKHGIKSAVKIIPIGIDYGDIVKSNTHIIINVGKPIDVSEYMDLYAENPVGATNNIRDRLTTDLENMTLNLATDNYYECFEIATEVANISVLNELKLSDNTVSRFVARQKVAERLVAIEKNNPDEVKKLDALCSEYGNLLKKLNLKTWVLDNCNYQMFSLIARCLFLLLTFPVFIYGFVMNLFPFFTPFLVRKYVLKPQFTGFFSSLHLFLGLITFPVFYILQTVLVGCAFDLFWWIIVFYSFSLYPLGKLAMKWYKTTEKQLAILRYQKFKQKKTPELLQAQNLREQIIRMIS